MLYSVNSYSSSSSRKGIGGLASGMDTDSLVEQLTSGTRSKITSHLQKKQLTLWKQEAYRSITSKVIAFNNKYFSTSGKYSLLSGEFFTISSIKNDSPFVNLTGDPNVAKNLVINKIQSLASSANFSSNNIVSDQKITTGKLESNWQENLVKDGSVEIKVGNSTTKISVGKDFKFSDAATTDELKMQELIAELNKQIDTTSLKGVVSFAVDSADPKKISISSTATESVEIASITANLSSALGITKGQSGTGTITGKNELSYASLYKDFTLKDSLAGSTLTVNLNGIEKKITFKESEKDLYSDPAKLQTYLQDALNKAYGTDKVKISLNASSQLEITTADKTSVFKIMSSDGSNILGEKGALRVNQFESNRVELTKSLEQLSSEFGHPITPDANGKYNMTINGVDFSFDKSQLLGDIIDQVNNSEAGVNITYSSVTDTFSVESKSSGAHADINISDTSGNLAQVLFGTKDTNYTVNKGTDAVLDVSFDGGRTFTTISRTENKFSFDGVTVELKGTMDSTKPDSTDKPIKFTVDTDSDELFKKFEEFIKDYNEILDLGNSMITEKKKKDYAPLTEEQKKEMSEDDIKNWEKAAKEGILQNDPYISNLLTELRNAIGSAVNGVGTNMSQIGVSPKPFSWEEGGKLHILDETKFKAALTENIDDIKNLFLKMPDSSLTDKKDIFNNSGIARRIDEILEKNVKTLGEDGILIRLAGIEKDSSESDNYISEQIKNIDKNLDILKDRLQIEEARYWRQFTAMERYINSMNQQSAWLSQQLGQ